ncbi:MAG: MFS transporter [Lactobacillales bacterium]|jgi:predicted MFS family arabinose efflux permease|nr:MFS transporter [Lactobacillales bacterium]
MKINKKIIFLGILIITFIISTIFLFQFFRLTGVDSEISMESINEIIVTKDGGIVAIDQAKSDIIKRTKTGKLDYLIKTDEKDRGFVQACEIVENNEDLYVLDTILEESNSVYVQQQRILKYTNGKFVKSVFEYTYPKKERKRSDGNFQSIAYENGSLYVVERQKDGFILHKVDEKIKKLHTVKRYDFADADHLLHSFVFKKGKMYALSKVGDIFQESKDGWNTLYKAENHSMKVNGKNENSFPWEMVVSDNGTIFATDIGTRTILKIAPSKKIQILKQTGIKNKPLNEQQLYYKLAIDKEDHLFLSSDNTLVEFNQKNGEVKKIEEVEIPFQQRIYSFSFIISFILLISTILLFSYLFIKQILPHFSFQAVGRLEISLFLFVTFTAFLISNMLINNYNERYKQDLLGQMSATAALVSSSIDDNALKEVNSPASFTTKSYAKLRKQLMKVIKDVKEHNPAMYIDLYKVNNGIIYTCANTNDQSGSYYPWEWEYKGGVEEEIYKTKKGKQRFGLESIEGQYIYALNPILDDDNNVIGLIELGSNMDEYIRHNRQMIWKVVFGTMSLIVVMMLLVREILTFSTTYQKWKNSRQESLKKPLIYGNVVRPIVFAYFLASNFAASFMPVYAASIYTPFLGISRDVASAFPMTFEMLFVALGFVGGFFSKKFGIKRMLTISLTFFAVGLLGCGLAQNVWQLTAGNSLAGFGGGMAVVVTNVYIGSLASEKEREHGFTSVNAAVLSGINIGIIIGATLAGFVGNKNVFYISSLVALLILGYVHYFVDQIPVREETDENSGMNFLKFLFKPKILIYLACILLPYLACGYFLHYFFPIFGAEKGLSELEIGQAFLLNGVWVVFLGPVIAKFILAKFGKAKSILTGLILYAVALAVFGFNPTLSVALIVLIVMGIADSFTFTAQNVYFTGLKEVEQYGVNKSMGIYSLFENLGQAIGPLLFSTVLMIGVSKGILLVCTILAFAGILFGLANIKNLKTKPVKIE